MVRWRSKALSSFLIVLMVAGAAGPAHAHNNSVHRDMTDYAYEVLLAGALFSGGQLPPGSTAVAERLARLADANPEMADFYTDMAAALSKLRALPSGVDDLGLPCPDSSMPDWKIASGTTLPQTPLGDLVLPVATFHGETGDCAIDSAWLPSGVLATVNVPTADANGNVHRDHTGITLGLWGTKPDSDKHDWRMRSTTLETLQEPIVQGTIAAGVTVAVSILCGLVCGLLPFLCPACPVLAVGAAGVVIDEINSVDASDFEHSEFAGLGHHVDVKAGVHLFDDRRGKFAPASGPSGNPDELETAIMALFDFLGFHVNHTTSNGPKNYEILAGNDAHASSVPRTVADWQTPIAIDLQFTPLDNLAKFGWEGFKNGAGTPAGTRAFGWPLHALGDATSPMHALGTTGHGHRPYEDVVDAKFHELVGTNNTQVSLNTVEIVLLRGLQARKTIQSWRTANGLPKDIPIRDLVTVLAAISRTKANAVPGVFQSAASMEYQFGSESDAKAAYDTPAIAAVQRDTALDAIAVKLAVLVSLAEVL
jgi:hypothetical protein